jgi:hypothetical protein
MTWSARIEHTPAELALTFGAPLSRLDMAPEVAAHLASLLAVEARHRLAGVVSTLVAENSREVRAPHGGAHDPGAKNKQFRAELASAEPSSAHPHFCDCLDCMSGDHDHV